MVADMIRRGQLTEAESRYHPNRSVITRALGTDPNMTADPYEFDAEAGDRLLLCSDGLTAMLEDGAIAENLVAHPDPAIAARMLVDAANDAGGHDNISVIIVDIEGDGPVAGSAVDKSGARAGRGMLAVIGWVLLLALIVSGIAYGSYVYARSQAFLQADPSGVVYIYQGVPGQIGTLQLQWLVESTTISVQDAPPADQQSLREGWRFDSLAQAREKARSLEATGAFTPDRF